MSVAVAVPQLAVREVWAVPVLDVLGVPVVAIDVHIGRVVADAPPLPAIVVPATEHEFAGVRCVVDDQADRIDALARIPLLRAGAAIATQAVGVVGEPAFLCVPRDIPVGFHRNAGGVGSVAVTSGGDVDVIAGVATGQREQRKGEYAHVNLLMGGDLLCHKNAYLSIYITKNTPGGVFNGLEFRFP